MENARGTGQEYSPRSYRRPPSTRIAHPQQDGFWRASSTLVPYHPARVFVGSPDKHAIFEPRNRLRRLRQVPAKRARHRPPRQPALVMVVTYVGVMVPRLRTGRGGISLKAQWYGRHRESGVPLTPADPHITI